LGSLCVIHTEASQHEGEAMGVRFKFVSRFIAAGILASGVAGCVGTESGQKQISDPTKISQIQKGVTTKADIRTAFGAPEGTEFQADGDEVWSYSYVKTAVDPKNFIPVLDIVAHSGTAQFSTLSVTFDSKGFVKAYSINNQSFGQSG
jgi:hypothetical protein